MRRTAKPRSPEKPDDVDSIEEPHAHAVHSMVERIETTQRLATREEEHQSAAVAKHPTEAIGGALWVGGKLERSDTQHLSRR